MYWYITFFVLCSFAVFTFADKQSVSVRLTITCGQDKVNHADVFLYDKDLTSPNDVMDFEQATYGLGVILNGTESEFTPLDPIIVIRHKCGKTCLQKTTIVLPKSYITAGEKPNTHDYGVIDLLQAPSEDVCD